MTATFETLLGIDTELARAGHHPLTPFWRAELERFYGSGATALIGRVGRGGAKSHTSAKVGLNETLFGDWRVPPGERHFWAFVSATKDEAVQRLLLLQSFLRGLGVPFDVQGDQIALRDKPRGFRVFACQVGAVSGFRCYGFSADELAKWESRETGANPAPEVCSSLAAMCVTHVGSRRLLISSPWSLDDYHAERFDQGDTDHQRVCAAPSWVANPAGITEAQTRAAEPDPRRWAREYAAIPSASASAALDGDAVTRAQREPPSDLTVMAPIVALDFSSGRGDSVVWSRVCWAHQAAVPEVLSEPKYLPGHGYYWEPVVDEHGRTTPNPEYKPAPPLLLIGPVAHQVGAFWQSIASESLVQRIAADCRRWGASWVIGDQREAYGLESMFGRHGIRFVSVAWTQPNKAAAVERIRRWLRDDQLVLPLPASSEPAARLDRELRAFEERLLPSGVAAYAAPRSGHDDHVATLVTAAIADSLNMLPLSPTAPRRGLPPATTSKLRRLGFILPGDPLPDL